MSSSAARKARIARGKLVDAAPVVPKLTEITPESAPIPAPTAIRGSWFPASVALPPLQSGQRPGVMHRVKVYAADTGLYIYQRPPLVENGEDPLQVSTLSPAWFSPIDYAKTGPPPPAYAARHGFPVVTAAGVVMVTASGGCPCSYKSLRDWQPPWATSVQAWKDGVQ